MKYRKKPVVVEAVQWFPGVEHPGVFIHRDRAGMHPYVVTIHEQKAYLAPGDWILPEPKPDRYYPVKDAVFRDSFEPVDEG